MKNAWERRENLLLAAVLLAILVLAAFWPLQDADFVGYDDHVYVTDNMQVRAGLSWTNIRWAFQAMDAGFWQPLTWLSLMLDHDLYRLNPGGYHWTNVLLHGANTLLLFLLLLRLFGKTVPSFLAAALFGVHPLHVESVAWIAQRKDVLAGLFWMLTLLAYVRYAERRDVARYGAVLLLFFLGLMAKPVGLVLPAVLLLLDRWPLRRQGESWHRLLLEKAPLAVLALGVFFLTYEAETRVDAVKSLAVYPWEVRLANAVTAYAAYIRDMIWPVDLAVFYPHPGMPPIPSLLLSVALLVAMSVTTYRFRRVCPVLAFGWLWYGVTLIPTAGLIQIGSHARADRYTYLPLIGLFIMIVWGGRELACRFRWPRGAVIGLAVSVVLVLAIMSQRQAAIWEDGETLFRHAASVTTDNALTRNNLGAALARKGRTAEAMREYTRALALQPDYPDALFNMGTALAESGRPGEAVAYYLRALRIRPNFPEGYNNLGIAYANTARFDEAEEAFRKALSLRPSYGAARDNLGRLLRERGGVHP